MCSVEGLRGFINERLSAAAVEIFNAVERTISQYQGEVDAERRLLDINGKPQTKLRTTGLPQQHVREEEEAQQLINKPKRSTLDLEEPDPPQNMESQEEPESPQSEHQKETQPPQVEGDQDEVCNSREREPLELKQESDIIMVTITDDTSEPEPDSEQPPSQDSFVDESHDQAKYQHVDPESTMTAGLGSSRRYHFEYMDKSTMSEKRCKKGKGKNCLKCEICGKGYKRFFQLQRHRRIHTGEGPHSYEQSERYTLDQENLESQPKKGHQVESCSSQEEQKQQNDYIIVTLIDDDNEHSVPEQDNEHPLSQDSALAERQGQKTDPEPRPKRGCQKKNVDNSPIPENQCKTGKGKKCLKCDICGKSYTRIFQLQKHHRTHTDEGPHSYETLGKTFIHKQVENYTLDQEEPQLKRVQENREDPEPLELERSQREPEPPQLKGSQVESEPQKINKDLVEPYHQVKGYQEGGCTGKEEQERSPKQEKPYIAKVTVTDDISEHSTPVLNNVLPLFQDSVVAESQNERKDQHVDSESTIVELKPKKRYHPKNVDDSPKSGKDKKCMKKCEICGKSFKYVFQMQMHQRSHTGEKPYSCETCGKTFSHKHHLKNHIVIHSTEKPFSCETCSKSFKHKKSLMSHKKIHTGVKPHSCGICGKSFVERNNLLVHKRSHTSEKPFFCEMCGKGYKYKNYLLVHMRCHTGEKPFFCSVCQRKFTTSSAMHKHKSVHTGIKPHSCEVCGKKFRAHSTLLGHMNTHTGEKPYSCKVCGKKFRFNGNIAVHMKSHTQENLQPSNVSRRIQSGKR